MELEGVQVCEIGYDIASKHWNKGFATEAAKAVRDYAFNTLSIPRLVSLIRVGNHASRRVAEKVGMNLNREVDRGEQPYWVFAMDRSGRF